METDEISLEGKRVLVTGGTTGVGRAVAVMCAALGCRVFICGRDRQHLADAMAAARGQRGEIGGISVDIGTPEGIDTFFQGADEWLGGVDIAILNAGVGAHGELAAMSRGEYRQVIEVNLISHVACARELVRRMKGSGGQIILTGSMSAQIAEEMAAVYVATKAGLRGFARSLRKEANLAGIRVSLIEPGSIGSDMVDEDAGRQREMQEELRMLKAEDVARAIVFVARQPPRCDVIELQVRPHRQII